MATEIFRQPTEQEKRDFRPLNVTGKPANPVLEFRKKLEIKEAKYFKEFKPFCARCGKLDFKDLMETQMKKIERKVGYFDTSQVIAPKLELDQYGDPDRFEIVRESDAMEPITITTGTIQRQIKIGVHRDYRCKVNDCGISIFIPIDKIEVKIPIKTRGKK